MALSAQNSDFISRGITRSAAILQLRADLELELGQWNLDGVYDALTDEDIAAKFPHLTKGKVVEYINAIKAILVALGTKDGNGDPVHNDISGQAANLIKMRG
jgi:hypothetical protein